MAHFAQLNHENIVVRVIVVDDQHEANGELYCEMIFGGRWKQTSYNNRIRKQFAAPGMFYSDKLDMFVAAQPHPWYELDHNGEWYSPIGFHPQTGQPLEDWQWDWLKTVYGNSIINEVHFG